MGRRRRGRWTAVEAAQDANEERVSIEERLHDAWWHSDGDAHGAHCFRDLMSPSVYGGPLFVAVTGQVIHQDY